MENAAHLNDTVDESDSLSSTDYVRAVVNILEDINDEKQRLETMQKAVLNILEDLEDEKRSAQEANRMKSEFLANMSHELRTPLNSIIGFSELMSDGKVGPIADNHKEYLGDILTSARHLLQLINDVLDLAKVEAGKLDFDARMINLPELIYGIRDTLRSIAASRNIQVDIYISADVSEIVGDPARLKQVLYNYLSNALKFTPEGGQVAVRAESEDDDFFVISVSDTGEGIAPEHLPRLFIEFEQLDSSFGKRHQGTGLGLALTKRIVEAQGGYVSVESNVGVGSRFSAVLPKRLRPEQVEWHTKAIPIPYKKKNPPKVLVVEDVPHERDAIMDALAAQGYEPHGVTTGADAIELSRRHRWDAITLDLNLPDIDGAAVLANIRSENTNADTPVIVISLGKDTGFHALAVEEILQKPIRPSELVEALRRIERRGLSGRNVMVVDDNYSDLKLVQTHLRELDYIPTGYCCGEDALLAIEHDRPDAIVLDLVMPGLGGAETLHRIRQKPEGRDIPVIIWSEHECNSENWQQDFPEADAYVRKGMGHQTLIDELSKSLPKRLVDALDQDL